LKPSGEGFGRFHIEGRHVVRAGTKEEAGPMAILDSFEIEEDGSGVLPTHDSRPPMLHTGHWKA
jgi:hypothetical protein